MKSQRTCGETRSFASGLTLREWSRISAVVLVLHVVGCSSFAPPLPASLRSADGRDRVLVLIRVLTEVDGREFPAFNGTTPELDGSIWLGVGDFSSGGKLRRAAQGFLSKDTMRGGWTYLLLEPGIYYLAPHPPRNEDAFTYDGSWGKMTPAWRLEITLDAPVVYAGTLFVPGRGSSLIFGGSQLQVFSLEHFEVRDESVLAEGIRAKWLAGIGTLSTRLVQPHNSGDPLILETPPNR